MPNAITVTRLTTSDAQAVAAGASAATVAVDTGPSQGPYVLYGQITNGAAAPTTNPQADIEFATVGSTWVKVAEMVGNQVANSVFGFAFQINQAAPPLVRVTLRSGATNGSSFGVWLSQKVAE
jgi:hypothetical protein